MKYIKKFETLLKFSDERVINHLFRPFAEKLKNILLYLKDIDHITGTNVRIYYDDSKEIKIIYGYKYNDLFNIRLIPYNRETMELTIILNYFKENAYKTYNKELYDIFDKVLEKYQEEQSLYYRYCYDIKIYDINDLSILDNIYNDLKNEFDFYLQTQKYNL